MSSNINFELDLERKNSNLREWIAKKGNYKYSMENN